jgi:hypothetical protein
MFIASILKIGDKWRVQVRRRGTKSICKTFPTKAAAVAWAQRTEAAIADGAQGYDPGGVTVGMMIRRYEQLRTESGRDIDDKSNEWYYSFASRCVPAADE